MAGNSRIIHAPINNGRRYAITSPITQYDYGYLLLPEGVELPTIYEIDFSNDEKHGTSLTVYGGAEGAEVPEELIRTGKDVYAFYYRVGDGYGKTEFTWRLPNKCRPSRDGETPTPSQQSSIDQLIVRSNEAVESAEQSAEDASASAQSAQGYAEQAETARDTAQTYANNAQTSANNASASASQASASASASAQSASQSAQIKADVEDMADDAQGYANSAQQSASDADQSAQESAESARASGESALSASNSALSSGEYASNALGHAESASTSAQTASTKAAEASQSASQALSYKTDAEQAKVASQTAQGLAESARDSAQDYAEDAQEYAEDAQASAESVSASASQIAQNTSDIASLEEDRYKPFVTDYASGSIASFPDGADGIPLKSLVVNINPVQDLSNGDPSPENICPISGWEGMNLAKDGVNLLALPVVRFNEASATKANCFFVKAGTYTFGYSCDSTHRIGIRLLDMDGNVYSDTAHRPISGFTYNASASAYYAGVNLAAGSKSYVLTIAEDCYIRIISNIVDGGLTNVQLELGTAATDYEPYNGQTIPIDWQSEAGTVYGGKLDVLSGVLRVTHRLDEYVGSSSEAWSVITSPTETTDRTYLPMNGTKVLSTVISSWLKTVSVASASNSIPWSAYINSSNRLLIHFPTGEFPTVDAWKTYLASHHLQVLCELAEPITYQLTPHEVNSLLGQNNIFADTGDVSCEYRADTKLYIERLTAPDSADMIADANIVSGQYFMIGNSLYKATANIASGASVIVGTNATRKSLSEALNEINA